MKINPALSGKKYRAEFVRTGAAVIQDFLVPEYAEELHKFFNETMPSDWWTSATYPGADGQVSYIRNIPENYETIENDRQRANQLFGSGHGTGQHHLMTYHFYRTLGDHYENCTCVECNLRKWLLSSELLDFLESVSGEKYTGFNVTFGSKYSDGCFLSPHTDHSNGDIGFVLQLTKDWKPQWGGNLHFMNDNGTVIEKTEVPTFNTLTLFRLVEQVGRWHYVGHVNPGVKNNRIAYTGWFVKEKN